MIRELIVTLSFLSVPAAVVVIVGGVAAPFLATPSDGAGGAETLTERGRAARIAYEVHCAACHGARGEGGAGVPGILRAPAAGLDAGLDTAELLARHEVWVPEGHRGLRPAQGTPDRAALNRAIRELRRMRAEAASG